MKKSVIVLIGVIYVLAVFAVSFFGLKTQVYNEKIYIERIEVINEGVKQSSSGENYIIIEYDESNPYFIIQRKIYPEHATTKVVEYTYDKTNAFASVDNDTGIVTFNQEGAITVYITAKDGSGVITTLKIIAK